MIEVAFYEDGTVTEETTSGLNMKNLELLMLHEYSHSLYSENLNNEGWLKELELFSITFNIYKSVGVDLESFDLSKEIDKLFLLRKEYKDMQRLLYPNLFPKREVKLYEQTASSFVLKIAMEKM